MKRLNNRREFRPDEKFLPDGLTRLDHSILADAGERRLMSRARIGAALAPLIAAV